MNEMEIRANEITATIVRLALAGKSSKQIVDALKGDNRDISPKKLAKLVTNAIAQMVHSKQAINTVMAEARSEKNGTETPDAPAPT